MSEDTNDRKETGHPEDLELVQAALGGDQAAAEKIEDRYRQMLIRVLVARQVPPDGAEDVVADLFSECYGARKSGQGKARFESYGGQSALSTWLVRCAWNKWLDSRRRDKFHGELPGQDPNSDREGDAFDQVADKSEASRLSNDLADLMRRAITAAFASLPPDHLMMMKLIYMHGTSQDAVARMWSSNQSKVSRALASARDQIERNTMEEVRRCDPTLDLHWDDFRELCQLSPVL